MAQSCQGGGRIGRCLCRDIGRCHRHYHHHQHHPHVLVVFVAGSVVGIIAVVVVVGEWLSRVREVGGLADAPQCRDIAENGMDVILI